MDQPQVTAVGSRTDPTRKSAVAIDNTINPDGDLRSFFRGSFQIDQMTNEYPKTIIGAHAIPRMTKLKLQL